jgi:hypothetical protein
MSSQEFTLLPMVLPRDAPQILQMHYRAHLADPANAQNPISEEEYFGTRKSQILSRFNSMCPHYGPRPHSSALGYAEPIVLLLQTLELFWERW